jgi:hypothetical protein
MTSTKHMLAVMGHSKKSEEDSTAFDIVDLQEPQLDEPRLTYSAQPSLGNVLEQCLNSAPKSKPTPQS